MKRLLSRSRSRYIYFLSPARSRLHEGQHVQGLLIFWTRHLATWNQEMCSQRVARVYCMACTYMMLVSKKCDGSQTQFSTGKRTNVGDQKARRRKRENMMKALIDSLAEGTDGVARAAAIGQYDCISCATLIQQQPTLRQVLDFPSTTQSLPSLTRS
jgi:hypothetical protein